MHYTSLNEYCRNEYGHKLYKLALESGAAAGCPGTCPNRDGLLDTRGCIFCSAGGSGDFADYDIETAKERVAGKLRANEDVGYIAYFQSFTGTYPGRDGLEDGTFAKMRERYLAAARHPDVEIVSIATRPDCLGPEVLELLEELKAVKPVWVELGLQTSNEQTAAYIRRCYRNDVYQDAVRTLNGMGIKVITHLILCLPGETEADMAASIKYAVECGTWGLKLQLLHVLDGTDLGAQFKAQMAGTPYPGVPTIELPFMEEYIALVDRLLEHVPEDVVIHRLTGDGPKNLLLAPLWTADKKRVLNAMNFSFDKTVAFGKE